MLIYVWNIVNVTESRNTKKQIPNVDNSGVFFSMTVNRKMSMTE